MSVFMIGYDLHEGEDYTDLINAIKTLGSNWWHCLDSTWFIISNSSAVALRDSLMPHMRSPNSQGGDKLLVVEISTPTSAAWTGSFPDNCKDWIKKNL